ncbi:FAD-binding oxidoreductase [Desulfobacula sp.]|uniref:FAD-binding oxidoreductase n=1 Tax=Desulfobacula sp. TaxID=2593537 RepID=UPI0025C67C6F|nr:FAD-binding oxidoreductase [Desulfobacula sp.]MBC2703787.1 FAD-binding oxidoreductase [Desulfobacula sp.]
MKKYDFIPDWLEREPDQQTFRSIFKWGAKDRFKHPGQGFFSIIKEELGLSNADFQTPVNLGNKTVENTRKTRITKEDITLFETIVGRENLFLDTYSRLKYSTGKSMEDIFDLRQEKIENICDIVLRPRSKEDIIKIVALCREKKIPVHVYGGGSCVTIGLTCPKGGVTLVMNTHMNKMIKFNEVNHTITVEPGMMGPEYEDLLNHAPEKLNAERRYTGGHFPQSFEFSSVGGWVVTLGSGQASSYYGDACDLVISQEYVTPTGTFKTHDFPATATGPKINDIMKGSEGCFGVLVGVTMKIFQYQPETARQFTFMFPKFETAINAAQQISQAESGMPSILRLSDPEETDVAMKMYGLEGSLPDKYMGFKGLKPGSRCLLMGQTDGENGFSKNLFKQIKKICKTNQGLYLTGYPMKKWQKGRFSDPYMRDALNDFGVLIDTLEASVTWDHLQSLYHAVRGYIKKHSHTICMTHASHFYAQGTNLYFIFITKMQDVDEFKLFQRGIIEKIEENFGSLSHHHGVGRMMAPFMEKHLGTEQMDVLRAIKKHFDPHNIMNPGGLGL